jgi:hypothetical protein
MAPAAKAPAKAAKTPVAKVSTKVKAKPKGLQLSTAQWKAYNKAYSATSSAKYQAIALRAATNRFRQYRLQSAYSTFAKANIATHNAQAAAIAAFATKMSYQQSRLAHQNAALEARIELDMYKHANLAGRAQFIQSGVKAYAHKAVMRTVDTTQARSYEEAIFAAAARAAKSAKASVSTRTTKSVRTPISAQVKAQIKAQSQAAGLRAAEAISTPAQPKARQAKTQSKAVANTKKSAKQSAQSVKAPVKKAKSRTAPRQGARSRTFDGNGHWILGLNDFEGTCIMTAVANALYHQTKWWLPDEDIAYWTGAAGPGPTIGGVLRMLYERQPWPQVELAEPVAGATHGEGPCIIGFGDHAAYAFKDKMVSYAELVPVTEDVEEAWSCTFTTR